MSEYLILRCYKCGTFQSHTLRKDSKFSCKICHEKQSYQKVFTAQEISRSLHRPFASIFSSSQPFSGTKPLFVITVI